MASALLLAFAVQAFAELPPQLDWRVWLEPRFMRQPVSAPIASAQKTELTGGALVAGVLEAWSKDEFAGTGLRWEAFAEQARANAAADLAQLKPVYKRNRSKVIEYAEIRSEKPIVASAVLAPGFRPMLEATMGPAFLLVVPNRQTAFIFSKLASNYQDYAPMVYAAYRETSHPVSMEVFEVTEGGMRAIGEYPNPRD